MRFSPGFLVPRSLRARLILLILGSVLLTQAATLVTVSYFRHKFMEDVAIGYIVTTIRTLRAALSEVPAEDRADFVRTASQNQWRLWSRVLPAEAKLQRFNGRRPPPPPRSAPRPPPPPPADARPGGMPPPPDVRGEEHDDDNGRDDTRVAEQRDADHAAHEERMRRYKPEPDDIRRDLRVLVQLLNERLNDGTRVALSRGPAPEIFISLAPNSASEDVPRLREWLVIPLDRLDPPVATPFIAAWLGGLGLLLLLAVGFSWHITRPITRLADAADRLAAGQPQRVEPSGPHETRALGVRFNAMLDALAESDSVRRTLLSGLPHDLKGPLSRMWLRIELADDSKLKEGLRTDLQDMQHMVDQFIGFVRGTDPAAYRYASMVLSDWLTERVGAWQGAGTDIHLKTVDDDAPLVVQADAVALGRLLDNLIGNALNHGAPPVDVNLRREDRYAVLDVADHGPGIVPDRRQEALRPFSRLDDARTRTGSVGLGLALAEAIARAHGGSLELLQAESGGLCVRVKLPLASETV
ncbi:sensor histidine kinase [Achromobacter kerstersii]|jgi:two-component system osmolarity sensor histidine kinase EnvZ|uniref:sensor histidine kinase n=1 Tax=Achromobacter kerstersii TaxID=1353890 RepID=UPI0006C41453|nr:HAMP domain-containing sensor histidine kinase [Achromobacter kerstersii]CUJ20561.1 Osmolarity sensor protein EnvZ [Achromobacter kerstersii]